ncbi:hypothetical protein Cgig2_018005 [Carnegiea gigantea]|uniref:NB-ARC domain-containing protein n=1 Tax=Carnegiea gigantea TaxID=171969 RepID=A0A9Q1GNP9_9CARY|nr:hypothetical protein Cgig2_018005 [Carnegiea gigantea]
MKGGNVSRKVDHLFSRYNRLAIAYKISRGVKEIRKRLDAIASNHNQFGFKLDCQPIRRRREDTCSYTTATIVEDEHIYKLEGLSKEDSWRLFEMTAFGQRYGQQCPPDLVEIGQGIVKRCANVPLAIKVVGSLLYNQGKEKWLWFQKAELGRLKDALQICRSLRLRFVPVFALATVQM